MMDKRQETFQSDIWVSLDFLSWGGYVQTSDIGNEEAIKEQYNAWRHAEELLSSDNQNYLMSCMMQLGRVINKGDKLLNEYYNFRRIPGMRKLKSHEVMEKLSIVKPVMRGKINEIRNDVVHGLHDRKRSKAECAELVEFVWYFLRSTDQIVARIPEQIQFDGPGISEQSHCWIEMTKVDVDWNLRLRGKLNLSRISSEKISDWAQVSLAENVKRIENSDAETEDEIYFSGKFNGSDEVSMKLIDQIFRAY